MQKFTIVLFFFFGITGKIFAQDVCLYALPDPHDSSNYLALCQLTAELSADFNQDGLDDLFLTGSTIDFNTNQTYYSYGTLNSFGTGYFYSSVVTPSTAIMYQGSATGDFNEDGYPDFIGPFNGSGVVTNISNGFGGFVATGLTVGGYPDNIVSGDFDNDGHEDFMIGCWSPNASAFFFHGNGNGTFAGSQILNSPYGPYSHQLHATDVNNDGITDVVCSNEVILSNGGGNFTWLMPAMPHSTSLFYGVADVNGDGNVDLLSSDSIYLGSGYGSFPTQLPLNLGSGFIPVYKPVDFNNDNDPDLIASKGDGQGMDTLYVFLGSTNATFIQSQFFMPITAYPYSICSGDFDGNGFQDFVFAQNILTLDDCISILQPVLNYSAGIIAASSSVCQGDSLQLSVNTTDQYLWSTGDTTSSIYVSTPGTYSVTTTTSYGCSSTDAITINQINATTFSSITSNNIFCLYSSSFPLSSGAPAGGTYSGPGVSNGIFNPQSAGIGTHTLIYTYSGPGGCTGSDSLQVTVDLCLGTTENNLAETISIYPNPSTGEFTISTDEKEFIVAVYDVLGNEVYSAVNEKGINITSQSKGIYFVRLIAGDKIYSRKIILQ